MTRHIPFSIVLLVFALVPQAAGRTALEQNTPGTLLLSVRIYDYAKPGAKIVDRTREEATRVLAKAGIQTIWLNCPLTMEGAGNQPGVRRGVRPGGPRHPYSARGDAPGGQQPN